jgi:hypothetical protein
MKWLKMIAVLILVAEAILSFLFFFVAIARAKRKFRLKLAEVFLLTHHCVVQTKSFHRKH